MARAKNPRSLKLILRAEAVSTPVELLELLALAARLWASHQHVIWVALALALSGPVGAVRLLVVADGRARAACDWAGAHHELWVLQALVVQGPNRACSRVLVFTDWSFARGNVTAEGASLQRVAGISEAFAVLCPSRAVIVRVLALCVADATGHGAVQVHETRVLLALAFLLPDVAFWVHVRALDGAGATRRRALSVHVVGR